MHQEQPVWKKVVGQVQWSAALLEPAHVALMNVAAEPDERQRCAHRVDRVLLYHDLELLLDSIPEQSRQPFLDQLRRLVDEVGTIANALHVYPEELLSERRMESWVEDR